MICRDAASYYWSASTYAINPTLAWYVYTYNGFADGNLIYTKTFNLFVRAVRSGS